MIKQEYMDALEKALEPYDDDLRQEIMNDFEEHFVYGLKSGHTEEEIINSLGSVEEVIRNIDEPIKSKPEPKAQELIRTASVRNVLIKADNVGVDIDLHRSADHHVHYDYVPANSYFNNKQSNIRLIKTIEEGDTLIVSLEKDFQNDKRSGFFLDGLLNVEIPADLETVSIIGKQGDIDITDLIVGSLSVNTMSGDIDIVEVAAQKINVNSTNGDIKISESTGDINCRSINGDTDLDNCRAAVVSIANTNGDIDADVYAEVLTAKTTNGDIDLDIKGAMKQLLVETVSGDIAVLLQNALTFNGRVESLRGDVDIRVDYPCTVRRNCYLFSDGQTGIDVKSLNGDIEIEQRGCDSRSAEEDFHWEQKASSQTKDGIDDAIQILEALKKFNHSDDLKELNRLKSVMDEIKADLQKKTR
ncbi:MAG: DUF4097 family beta strand repeat-containing protein [Erysipelotrichaceae bacterium]|nr:DUF4097 family beta strand repeat-containing protein [Erysipelotrichaceae bacterium]